MPNIGHEALKVYLQWVAGWTKELQKSDQSMTHEQWMAIRRQHVYENPKAGNNDPFKVVQQLDGTLMLKCKGFRSCSMNETTYLWTSVTSVFSHLED